jgi:acetyl-CoA carboxylase beta subunit
VKRRNELDLQRCAAEDPRHARREVPENLWIKCPETGQLVFYKDVEANQFVIPGSNYHMRMSAPARA